MVQLKARPGRGKENAKQSQARRGRPPRPSRDVPAAASDQSMDIDQLQSRPSTSTATPASTMRQMSVTIPAAVLGDPCEGGDETKALVPIQGSIGSHQWKGEGLQGGVSEKTQDEAALDGERVRAPLGKGRGTPGPRVLSPNPGLERNASCEGSTGAAAAGQNPFDPMTPISTLGHGEEEFGEKAALRVLGQENLTKVQLAQGTPTTLSSYGTSAASESQQPNDVSPVHSSQGAGNEDFEEAKGDVDHHINNISGGDLEVPGEVI
ncbi:hypothetical protein OEA41_004194 [Lepraria neglecta]|uniref:Uncharacterized protein n=1 Tax=Lepraria neglecta TaxID=209136 RepID=A0AAD9Z5M6_9LECA|nr:hypothetical protein OEA41_004194 [Lepraria neglecta]